MNAARRPVARCVSRAQVGLQAPLVEIEVHLGAGLPTFSIVGLAATAVKESKERVRAALVNGGFEFPAGRITVNLAPADLPKDGGRFDLPIALGILVASGQIEAEELERIECYGELGLGGELKSVPGLLLAAGQAARAGHAMIVPAADAGGLWPAGGELYAAANLGEVSGHLARRRRLDPCRPGGRYSLPGRARTDLAEVRGQALARRALVVAAAGAHSLLLVGPPGSGKTLLAQCLPGLLPPLEPEEALEVASIAAVSRTGFDAARWGERPYRSPHHTATAHAVIGGGPQARPGEVSLAHHGVLFLDELPEFDRRVLEALREPLEAGSVAVSRAAVQAVYPARFLLVGAMNPCPCGWYGSAAGRCSCAPPRVARYRARLSGPLLDRLDLRIEVGGLTPEELLATAGTARETSADAALRVRAARDRQLRRAGVLNSALGAAELERCCELGVASRRIVERTLRNFPASARSVHKLLRVARTLADLAGAAALGPEHLAEAVQLRRALERPPATSPSIPGG